MATTELLQARVEGQPSIYAYELPEVPSHRGLLKVGYTVRTAEERVAEQCRTAHLKYKIVLVRSAMKADGTSFDDHAVHRVLRGAGFYNPEGEWFRCSVRDVERAIKAVKAGSETMLERTETFAMRPEQRAAVKKTAEYFESFYREEQAAGRTGKAGSPQLIPHFLWNAKMRFGKTFTTYQLALRMGWRRLLVLTFKPAVKTAWKEDLLTHRDFEGWQFCEKGEYAQFNRVNERKPFVCFASFQDVLGRNAAGGIKATNEWIQEVEWDCIVLDEYHYGAWGKHAKDFYNKQDVEQLARAVEMGELMAEDAADRKELDSRELYDEELMPLTTRAYLYLSGTPFRAISTGEFIEEQIYNWTYSDEQRAKEEWDTNPETKGKPNPYKSLPKMVMMTYQLPDSIKEVADQGEFDEFDLNEFFRADERGFVHEEHVQKWLDLIRGTYKENIITELKQGKERPPMPFSDVRLHGYLQHTYWFLPSVAACKAMERLMAKPINRFYHDYEVVVAAGNEAGMGAEAVVPVYEAMQTEGDPRQTKTITLSCGKLSTGVTVRPWTGILMLRNARSPETYFQAAFRVQSPWTTRDEWGKEVILKPYCYVFDFAPNRALRQVEEYSCQLNLHEPNPEKKVEEFIRFLPVLAYDGSSMKEIDAAGILDMAMSGTTATLLARRWESAVLVNVDNTTLSRLMNSPEAMKALMNIEGFRSLNQDIETIINKSEQVKKTKREQGENLTPKQKKELTEAEKEYKSKRKEIQQKLIKFATRIPVFMYLTDFREYSLKDVIVNLEPELFRKVTGLSISDFDLLVSLNVFNSELMNDAVYKFKRYEDSSLNYTGIDMHKGTVIGGWDTTIEKNTLQTLQTLPSSQTLPSPSLQGGGRISGKEEDNVVTNAETNEQGNHSLPVGRVRGGSEGSAAWTHLQVGDTVTHKSFGKGVVKSIDERFIIVAFAHKESRFPYPWVFEQGYMSV